MEPQPVQDYLRSRLGTQLTVRKVKRSFPGASRETWLVFGEDASGREESFVLRADPPEGAGCAGDLRQEYDVYAKLFASEVPVAEPLWYDEGIDMCEGRPHMVRRMVAGTSNVAGLLDDDADAPDRRRRVAYECIEKLALVHSMDWKAHGFDALLHAPDDAADCMHHELAIWKRHWFERRPFASPILEETLSWLEQIVPRDTPRISLVKGNNGLGEEIWQGEKIVAMSDWELACLSDGIADLFWSQGTVRLIGFEEVLRHYEQVMGQTVSFERLVYANVFALVKQMISTIAYWYLPFHKGRTNKPYAFTALNYMAGYDDKLARALGRPLDEVWQIVNGGEKAMYLSLSGSRK